MTRGDEKVLTSVRDPVLCFDKALLLSTSSPIFRTALAPATPFFSESGRKEVAPDLPIFFDLQLRLHS